jgi:hypothetical protein
MLALIFAVAVAQPATILYASGGWAAIDRGARCEALTRSEHVTIKNGATSVAGVTFDSARRHWGEFHLKMRSASRPGSSIVLDVADRSFLLEARGTDAWARDRAQDRAIIAALRDATGMKVTARDAAGHRVVERFATRGAATAIDAAAAACAGKMR